MRVLTDRPYLADDLAFMRWFSLAGRFWLGVFNRYAMVYAPGFVDGPGLVVIIVANRTRRHHIAATDLIGWCTW